MDKLKLPSNGHTSLIDNSNFACVFSTKIPCLKKPAYASGESQFGRLIAFFDQTNNQVFSLSLIGKISLEQNLANWQQRFKINTISKSNFPTLWKSICHQTDDKINLFFYGTSFQLLVWKALAATTKTTTYKEIAKEIGIKNSARAVGNAVGKNPFFYLNPCHLVLTSSGELGGFYHGQDIKNKMLTQLHQNQI